MSGLSVRAYAEHRKALGLDGATPQAVSNALREGRIERTADGGSKIDPDVADRQWSQRTDDRRKGNGSGDSPSLVRAQIAHTTFKARREEVALQKELGRLVERETIRREAFEAGRQIRERLESLPARYGPETAPELTPTESEAVWRKAVREVLDELQDVLGRFE